MYEKVKQAIDEWDCINILMYDPNEYDIEVKQIVNRMSESDSAEELAEIIHDVFEYYFSGIFKGTYEECLAVARKII